MVIVLRGLKIPYDELAVLEVRTGNQAPSSPDQLNPRHADREILSDECPFFTGRVVIVKKKAILNPFYDILSSRLINVANVFGQR